MSPRWLPGVTSHLCDVTGVVTSDRALQLGGRAGPSVAAGAPVPAAAASPPSRAPSSAVCARPGMAPTQVSRAHTRTRVHMCAHALVYIVIVHVCEYARMYIVHIHTFVHTHVGILIIYTRITHAHMYVHRTRLYVHVYSVYTHVTHVKRGVQLWEDDR